MGEWLNSPVVSFFLISFAGIVILIVGAKLISLQQESTPPEKSPIDISSHHPLVSLPPIARHFINRESEIDEIHSILRRGGSVLTISGAGGVGKTAVVAEAVNQLVLNGNYLELFPDGILFYSFYSQGSSELVFEYIAREFGVELQADAKAAAKRALSRRQVLVVLDGAEEYGDLKSLLHIRGSSNTFLITTRTKDNTYGDLIDLDTLPIEEAVRLLRLWAPNQPEYTEIEQEICSRLDGHPLAIRLAGSYMNRQKVYSDEYLDWLRSKPLDALSFGTHQHESIAITPKK